MKPMLAVVGGIAFLAFPPVARADDPPFSPPVPGNEANKSPDRAAEAKQVPTEPELVLTAGVWQAKANFEDDHMPDDDFRRQFFFTIKNSRLTWSARTPIVFSCGTPGKVIQHHGMILAVTSTGSYRSSAKDFSKGSRWSGAATFESSFTEGGKSVTVKGTFLSSTSASGTISVKSKSCSSPTGYQWQATPMAKGAQASERPTAPSR